MNTAPREVIESFLRERRASNEAQNIWPSENAVIDRLLNVGSEMEQAYSELMTQLPAGSRHPEMNVDRWCLVVDAILGAATVLSPEKTKMVRDARKDALILTEDIQKAATHLANLLRKRTQLLESNGLRKDSTDYHPVDLFKAAAQIAGKSNYHTPSLFTDYVWPDLDALRYRFDLKYWPDTADLIQSLAESQEDASICPDNAITRDAIESRKASVRDFMRSLDGFVGGISHYGADVQFSHASYAAIVNGTLGLAAEVTPEEVKAYRASERKRNAA